MSFGALAAIGGAGLSIAQDFLQSTGPLAKAQLKQQGRVTGQNLEYQKAYDRFKSALDYDYAAQYARNSAKWNVEGLKAANLNPILAATDGNFRGTFGSPSSGSISAGSVSASRRDATSAASLAASTARNNELVDKQIEHLDAQIENTKEDTRNKHLTKGLNGKYGAGAAIMNSILENPSLLHTARDVVGIVPQGTGETKTGRGGSVRVFLPWDKDKDAVRHTAKHGSIVGNLQHISRALNHFGSPVAF